MSGLYVEVDEPRPKSGGEGAAADIVLVHGWGLHGGVFEEVARDLSGGGWRVWRVDLPGHGRSPLAVAGGDYRLAGLARAVARALEPRLAGPAWWLGWSLGGLVALALALNSPAAVAGLVTVATTPRFVTGADWPWAVAPEVLAGFERDLAGDYRATLLRFLALQARGGDHAREDVRRLRERVFARGEPDPSALRGGLAILAETDLRARLEEIAAPVLAVGGERDTLVPPAAVTAFAQALPRAEASVIAGAGHAPFISDRPQFIATVKPFIDARH